uniref:T9SS type A sorting domain-containing protein n=1 Tax=Portibacter marinus TaxID=2898660 RepID=UPI001F314679
NTSSVSQTIIVEDKTAPVAPAAPADLTLDCAADLPPPVNLTASDNCDGDITVSPTAQIIPGSCLNNFTMFRTWTFTDTCGNTSAVSQTIIVEDKTAPVAPAAPADLTLDCAADLPPPVNLTATDNCDGDITVSPTALILPGSCLNDFTMFRTWTFTDTCGNASSVSQKIVVLDDAAPVAPAAPADLILECGNDVPPPVNLTAIDYCDGDITVSPTAQIIPGSCLNDFTMVRTWTFTDTCGNTSSVSQTIIVEDNTAPVPPAAPAGLILDCADEVPPPINLTAIDYCDGEITVSPTVQITAGTSPNAYSELRTWTFVDTCGNVANVTQLIDVGDSSAPNIPILDDITAECELSSLTAPEALDNCAGLITGTTNVSLPISDLGLTVINWEFDDGNGNTSIGTQNVIVYDLSPPEMSEIIIPLDPIQLGTSINASSSYTDNCDKNDHSGTWFWGDASGSSSPANIDQNLNTITGSHTYSEPGVYIISLYLTDASGNSSELAATTYAVIYDPNGGFVTGGGWIESPMGAYRPDVNIYGKANFGFISKFKKGANVPDGNSTFHLNAANFNFKSTVYDWLVIAGANAKFKGEGQVNGEGNYGFMITGIDSDINEPSEADKFRIKIWDMDNGDFVIYDNQFGEDDESYQTQDIGGGSITVHKSAKGRSAQLDDHAARPTMTLFPNPARERITIKVEGGTQNQKVKILDQLGKVVWMGYAKSNNQDSEITINTGDFAAGIYFTTINVANYQIVNKFVIIK